MYQKTLRHKNGMIFLTYSLTFSFASSIKWDYREVVHMATTNVVRSEFILGVCAISTGNGTYVVHVCNIVDDNRVPVFQCTCVPDMVSCSRVTPLPMFSPDYIGFCHGYHFSVVPVNGAGEGERSQNVTGYLINSK